MSVDRGPWVWPGPGGGIDRCSSFKVKDAIPRSSQAPVATPVEEGVQWGGRG